MTTDADRECKQDAREYAGGDPEFVTTDADLESAQREVYAEFDRETMLRELLVDMPEHVLCDGEMPW